jgi:uncharacterized membrane protein YphA (DoxX/SURF4 family)
MDMWKPFRQSTQRNAPQAAILFDISFVVPSFWNVADPPPVRAQKLNAFIANFAIAGGLIYVIVAGPGPFSFMN